MFHASSIAPIKTIVDKKSGKYETYKKIPLVFSLIYITRIFYWDRFIESN